MRTVKICDKKAPCPMCGTPARYHCKRVTNPIVCGEEIRLIKTIHHCPKCDFYFPNPKAADADFGELDSSGRYAKDIIRAGVECAYCCRTLEHASRMLEHLTGVRVPIATIHAWYVESDLYDLRLEEEIAARKRQKHTEHRDDCQPLFV